MELQGSTIRSRVTGWDNSRRSNRNGVVIARVTESPQPCRTHRVVDDVLDEDGSIGLPTGSVSRVQSSSVGVPRSTALICPVLALLAMYNWMMSSTPATMLPAAS